MRTSSLKKETKGLLLRFPFSTLIPRLFHAYLPRLAVFFQLKNNKSLDFIGTFFYTPLLIAFTIDGSGGAMNGTHRIFFRKRQIQSPIELVFGEKEQTKTLIKRFE